MTSPPTHTLSALFAPLSSLRGVDPKLLPLLARLLRMPGKAPRVILEATHENVLQYAPLSALKRYALDLN